MTDEAKALVELQRAAGLKDLPTPLTHDLRIAVSGKGPRAYDWQDKPHRLLYDACAEIETQAREIERLRNAMVVMDNTVQELTEALREMFEAVCGETGFAQAVRAESGIPYPWPALDLAEAMARAALAGDSRDQ